MDDSTPLSPYAKSDFDMGNRTFDWRIPGHKYGEPLPSDRQAHADMNRCHSIAHNMAYGTGFVVGVAPVVGLSIAVAATTPAVATGVGAVIPTAIGAADAVALAAFPVIAIETGEKLSPLLYEACRGTTDTVRKGRMALKADAQIVGDAVSSAGGVVVSAVHAAANYVGEKLIGKPAKPPTPPGSRVPSPAS